MGDRGNVKLKYENGEPIYFYTHWTGSKLEDIVRKALKRGISRWNDESYLSRIIFSEMIKDEVLETTGYGIAPYETDMGELITVDFKKQTITLNTKNNEKFLYQEFV